MGVNQVAVPRTHGSLTELLDRLVLEQQQDPEMKVVPPSPIGARLDLLKLYTSMGSYRDAKEEAIERYSNAENLKETKRLGHRLAGRLFQDIAYLCLSAAQPYNFTLLSPERTKEFFAKLQRERTELIKQGDTLIECMQPFGQDSYINLWIPDGLIVWNKHGRNQILTVCEYTTHESAEYFNKKIGGFNVTYQSSPDLLGSANLLFVVPEKFGIGEHYEIPINSSDFRVFVDCVQELVKSTPYNGAINGSSETNGLPKPVFNGVRIAQSANPQ